MNFDLFIAFIIKALAAVNLLLALNEVISRYDLFISQKMDHIAYLIPHSICP